MKDLVIEGTKKTLGIACRDGYIELNGCSISNDPKTFFQPVFDWVKDYSKNPSEHTTVNCNIEYVDSASLKNIFELMKLLALLDEEKTYLKIIWNIDYNDPELLEMGEILESKLNKKFTYI